MVTADTVPKPVRLEALLGVRGRKQYQTTGVQEESMNICWVSQYQYLHKPPAISVSLHDTGIDE